MVFSWVKNSVEYFPPSLPVPESFIPPNGIFRSRTSQQLTQIVADYKIEQYKKYFNFSIKTFWNIGDKLKK